MLYSSTELLLSVKIRRPKVTPLILGSHVIVFSIGEINSLKVVRHCLDHAPGALLPIGRSMRDAHALHHKLN
jgi:hypothetical protein